MSRSGRIAVALVAGSIVACAVAASAASLGNVTSGSLGSSTAAVSGCQQAAMTITWSDPVYSATAGAGGTPTYAVPGLTLSGLQTQCQHKSYRLTVATSAGTSLSEASGTTPNSSAMTVTFGSPADSARLGSVTLTIFNT